MIIQTNKELRPRDPADFYPTPVEVCRAALALLPDYIMPRYMPWLASVPEMELILDPGAGTGVWGQVARERWPMAEIVGSDIRDLPEPDAYDHWITKHDFCHASITAYPDGCDLVMGNPPYKFAEQFVRKAIKMARSQGYVVFLLRLAFLEGQARARGLWRDFPPKSVHVLSARPSFIDQGDKAGKTDATAYAIFLWQKDWRGQTELGWLDWKPASDIVQPSLFGDEV